MRATRFTICSILLLLAAGAARAQGVAETISTDRPGFLFSSATVGRGVFQAELGLPQVTQDESEDGFFKVRSESAVALLRYGVTDRFELRLGAPVYTRIRADVGPFHDTASGYGDLEVGAKWHLSDNHGGQPSFALIPSVIVPTGKEGFSAEDPIYQLNLAAEWTLANGWGVAALGGYLNGPSDGDRYNQETVALSLGRSLPSPAWSAYGEVAFVATDITGASDTSFAGGGIKYLATKNVQLDLSFDRGLTDDSPDWLFGFGLSARFH
jgi:hypothetical protein